MAKISKDSAMLMDVQYVRPNKKKNLPDYLYIIWKDMNTGKKYLESIDNPSIEIYFEKPEFRDHTYNKNYTTLDKVLKKTVKYRDVIFSIADDCGDQAKSFIKRCFEEKNYDKLKELYLYPYVYGADYDIRAYYRYLWRDRYDNDKPKELTKGFMDIETDIMEANGFPNPEFDPIDLVTLIDVTHNQGYTFCLVDKPCKKKDTEDMTESEARKEYERRRLYEKRHETEDYYINNRDEMMKKVHEMFDESYPEMNYNFYFYNNEAKMLVHLFQLINQLKLDFIGVWNIEFDIPYIIGRLKTLGLDPAEVMCPKDFPNKECYFKKDKRNFAIKNKNSFFKISSYTVFVDQMVLYAAIRKGSSELRSYKLTYIANKEIGDEKLDYSEVGNLKVLGYKDWLTYVLYNIKDVLLQKGIEERTFDLDTYYLTSYQNITPYENEFKQTVKLRNAQYYFYLTTGKVPGENVNSVLYNETSHDKEDEEKEKFEGALVGDPVLIDNFGVELFGKKTNNIFKYSIDMDMSAFYPSTIFANNIDPSTLIFKMILNSDQFDARGGDLPYHGITDVQIVKENKDSFEGDVAKEVMDNFQTRDYLSFGYKWMNLPSVNEVYDVIEKKLEK